MGRGVGEGRKRELDTQLAPHWLSSTQGGGTKVCRLLHCSQRHASKEGRPPTPAPNSPGGNLSKDLRQGTGRGRGLDKAQKWGDSCPLPVPGGMA